MELIGTDLVDLALIGIKTPFVQSCPDIREPNKILQKYFGIVVKCLILKKTTIYMKDARSRNGISCSENFVSKEETGEKLGRSPVCSDMVDSSSIAFWGILGGLSLLCIVTVILVYCMCFSRNPKYCMSTENEELLETTVHHEEVHTVTSETRTSVSDCEEPTVVHRTEHVRRIIRKQRSWGNVLQAKQSEPVTKIQVSPRSESSDTQTSSSNSRLVGDNNESGYDTVLNIPRRGKLQTTSIGAS